MSEQDNIGNEINASDGTDIVPYNKDQGLINPAKLVLSPQDLGLLHQTAIRFNLDEDQFNNEIEGFRRTIYGAREGLIQQPSLEEITKTHDPKAILNMAVRSLKLIAASLINTDGTIIPISIGNKKKVGSDLNNLEGIFGKNVIIEAFPELSVIELAVLTSRMSASKKEQLDNLDIEFCDSQSFAEYMKTAIDKSLFKLKDEQRRRQFVFETYTDPGNAGLPIAKIFDVLLERSEEEVSFPGQVFSCYIKIHDEDIQTHSYADFINLARYTGHLHIVEGMIRELKPDHELIEIIKLIKNNY